MVNQIYPLELQLNKANTSDTEAPFFDLHLPISNDFFPPKFMINAMTDFDIVNVPFMDRDVVPLMYISQHVRFAIVCV